MAPHNKLLVIGADGRPMIQTVARNVLASQVRSAIVVVGHQADAMRAALQDLDVRVVVCGHHAAGLSRSLRAGLRALPSQGDAVLVCLGDMPGVASAVIDTLIAAWRPGGIVVPVYRRQRGNPVLWDRSHVAAMLESEGDRGARWLLDARIDQVIEVVVRDPGVVRDVDTTQALRALPGGPWRAPDGSAL